MDVMQLQRQHAALKQPAALYLLFFVQMWECFSYYGMRAILVLFMTKALGYSDYRAFSVYAIYTALVEVGNVIGGHLADRYIGTRYAIFLGGTVIILGHLSMAIPLGIAFFYLGLGFIVVGTGLFRSNCIALLSDFYEENDPRKDAAFTLYYVGTNLGALLAIVLCGYIGETFGWHYGFSLAAFGMLCGNIMLYKCRSYLEDKGFPSQANHQSVLKKIALASLLAVPVVATCIFFQQIFVHLLVLFFVAAVVYVVQQARGYTGVEKRNLLYLGALIFAMAIFFAFEEQLGSTLILFSERHVDRSLFRFTIPSSVLLVLNPMLILVIGPLISKLWDYCNAFKNKVLLTNTKIAASFLLLGLAFAAIYAGCLHASSTSIVSLGYILVGFSTIALAELFIAPTVYAACSSLSPHKLRGVMMGAVMLGFSLANILSGVLSQWMAIDPDKQGVIDPKESLSIYQNGFSSITMTCLVIACGVFLCAVVYQNCKRGKSC